MNIKNTQNALNIIHDKLYGGHEVELVLTNNSFFDILFRIKDIEIDYIEESIDIDNNATVFLGECDSLLTLDNEEGLEIKFCKGDCACSFIIHNYYLTDLEGEKENGN